MRLKLFLCAFLFCAITNAQSNAELKDFINKNRSIIKNIQKNMIIENNTSYTPLKELVKNQVAAVKLYTVNKEASFYYAYLVRTESLNLLKTNIPEIYKITDTEKSWVKLTSNGTSNELSETEIKTVDSHNFSDAQSLTNLPITVQ